MSNWNLHKKKQQKYEYKWLGLILSIIVAGLFSKFCFSFLLIDKYDELALTVLPIEASLFAVIFSIIALLSGRLTDEYLGVNIIHFTMDIKPYFLKQKTIIISSLALLLINIFLYMIKAYDLLLSVFGVSCVLMTYSIFSIYSVLSGEIHLEDEIWDYYSSMTEDKSTAVSTFNDFVKQWKRDFPHQEELVYSKYMEAFHLGFSELVKNDQTRPLLLDRCTEISKLMLKKPESAVRGILFVDKNYTWCLDYCQYTRKEGNNTPTNMQKEPFHLFSNVYREFCEAIQSQNMRNLEKTFLWTSFSHKVLSVNFCLGYTDDSETANPDIDLIPDFGEQMGYYISTDYSSENSKYRSAPRWTQALSMSYFEKNQRIEAILSDRDFRFILSLFLYNNDALIKTHVFKREILDTYLWHQARVMMVLKFHCYLYYLARIEHSTYCGEDLKQRAELFVTDETVKKSVNSFVIRISEKDKNVCNFGKKTLDIFNESFMTTLLTELEPFECRPIGTTFKPLVMENAISNYVLFLSTYLSCYHFMPEILDKVISENTSVSLYPKFRETDCHEELEEFLKLFPLSQEQIDNFKISGYSNMLSALEVKYKNHFLHKAKENQHMIDSELSTHKNAWENKIKSHLETQFSKLISVNSGRTFKANLMRRIWVDQGISLNEILQVNYDHYFLNSVAILANQLFSEKKANKKSRVSFSSDDELIEYIKLHKEEYIAIGSEFALRTNDYHRRSEVKDLLHEMDHQTTGAPGIMMFVKKNSMKLMIKRLRIGKHAPAIWEINDLKHDPEQNKYLYTVNGSLVSFDENELQDYIKDKWRLIDVIVHFQLETKDGIIADIVTE